MKIHAIIIGLNVSYVYFIHAYLLFLTLVFNLIWFDVSLSQSLKWSENALFTMLEEFLQNVLSLILLDNFVVLQNVSKLKYCYMLMRDP